MKIHNIHILLHFLYPMLVFSLHIDEIPLNERILIIELEEGSFDSLYWEELSPFYIQPLSVPMGELRYLYDLFPNLPDNLPLTLNKLEKYEPWTSEHIGAFFDDYPFLLPFKALLSFEGNYIKSFGHIKFSSKMINNVTSYDPTVSIIFYPFKHVNAEGTFTFDDVQTTWQRRRLTFHLPYVGTIQIGNFSQVLNKGLFYGYFPKSKDSTNSIKNNWLYGDSRTWNGIASKTSIGENVTFDLFLHKRTTESIGGIKTTFKTNTPFTLYGAFSSSFLREDTAAIDTMFSAHWGASFKKKIFSITIECGINTVMLHGIPLYSEIRYGNAEQKYRLTLLRVPDTFSAPRSRLLHSFYNLLDTSDSTKGVITMMSISSIQAITDYLKQSVSISYLSMDHTSSFNTSLTLAGKKPCIYSLTYSLSSGKGVNGLKQKIKLSHTNLFTGNIGMTSHISLNFDQKSYWRFLISIRSDIKLISAYSISPLITYTVQNMTNKDFSLGLKQQLNLFEKTYGEFTLIFPIISQYSKNTYSIYATLNFLL